jgi:hypothetical protein
MPVINGAIVKNSGFAKNMDKVLVVTSYTDFKYYCRPLFPRAFNDLTYPNKELLFITEKNYPGISKVGTGDVICGMARAYGIEYAIKHNFDWVLFLDVDLIPDPGIIEELLAAKHSFVGGVVATRGDSTKIIGHLYDSWDFKGRIPLNYRGKNGVQKADGISGAMMMVHKSIFKYADYKGYTGVDIYPGRTTCDDEFYCIQVQEKTRIEPFIQLNARSWHLHSDGYGYRWYGEKKAFRRLKNSIIFEGKLYE